MGKLSSKQLVTWPAPRRKAKRTLDLSEHISQPSLVCSFFQEIRLPTTKNWEQEQESLSRWQSKVSMYSVMFSMNNRGRVVRFFCQMRHDESGYGVEHVAGFIVQTF